MQEIMQFVCQHFFLSGIWTILLGILILTIFRNKFSKVNEITRNESVTLINKENAVVIDLRNQDDYCKGHITNSLNLTVSDMQSDNIKKLGKVKTKPVIIVAYGTASRTSARNLIKNGFERVYVLKEGISGWNREHLPLVQ